nr:MAG TPA: hypothetical protein [Caudoviricetes sp.]
MIQIPYSTSFPKTKSQHLLTLDDTSVGQLV